MVFNPTTAETLSRLGIHNGLQNAEHQQGQVVAEIVQALTTLHTTQTRTSLGRRDEIATPSKIRKGTLSARLKVMELSARFQHRRFQMLTEPQSRRSLWDRQQRY